MIIIGISGILIGRIDTWLRDRGKPWHFFMNKTAGKDELESIVAKDRRRFFL